MNEHIPISQKEQLLLLKFGISQKAIDSFNDNKEADIKDIYIKAAVNALLYKAPLSKSSKTLKSCFLAILKKNPCRGTEDFDSLIKIKYKKKKKKKDLGPTYEKFGTVSIDDVLPFVQDIKVFLKKGDPKEEKEFHGQMIYMDSLRYRTFKEHGVVCAECGLKGEYFAVERHINGNTERCHLNLYAIDENGKEIMMTIDHVIPKSRGGANHIKNTVPMCSPCNLEKGKKLSFK